MKPTKLMLCAVTAGLMTLAFDKAQATVISDNLYVPLNIKATFSYVASAGKIKQATFTSKQILTYLGANGFTLPKGTQLAVGPSSDVYAISKTAVLYNLTTHGVLYFEPSDTIDTSTGTFGATAYKYSEAGLIVVDFYSDGAIFADNTYAAELTGSYMYSESDSKEDSAFKYSSSVKFGSKNLNGYGYDTDQTDSKLPVSGSASGSASGKLVD